MQPDEPGIRFKSKKRTKTLRQRDASPSTHDVPPTHDREAADTTNDDASAVHTALKLRQTRGKSRRFRSGVGFGRNDDDAQQPTADETSLVLRDAAPALPDRFMHQTGFVTDADDKHMMAYVESRLSSRAAAPTEPAATETTTTFDAPRRRAHAPGTVQTGTSTTSFPRLVEVQVPATTKRAPSPPAPPPPRRRRTRRGSDDMKRDAMVEAFLHENKLDVYDIPTTSAAPEADEALAADFRRQYMDEVAARRQRRRPAVNQPRLTARQQAHQQAVAAGEVLRGPKLGGSRNARAAVRDALLQQQELKKKEGR